MRERRERREPKVCVFDMDGTLCDVRSIRDYVTGDVKDFPTFHRLSRGCPENKQVTGLLWDAVAAGYTVIVVTARPEQFRDLTQEWLLERSITAPLYMRKDGDYRPDFEVKDDILDQVERDHGTVEHAVDDNPALVELFERRGVDLVKVTGYNEDTEPCLENVPWWAAAWREQHSPAQGPNCEVRVEGGVLVTYKNGEPFLQTRRGKRC